jgi:cathepsin L
MREADDDRLQSRDIAMFWAFAVFAVGELIVGSDERSFVEWMRRYNQVFVGEEYHLRLGVWMVNARYVREFRGNFQVSLNDMSALTPSELRVLHGFIPIRERASPVKSAVRYDPTWDWRDHKPSVVGPIQSQGGCGSCWSFAAVQAAESVDAIKAQPLLKFSEQNFVDCADQCWGCVGGNMNLTYQYIIAKQGGKFMLESDYPYKGSQGKCQWDPAKGVGSVSDFVRVKEDDEEDLATKIQQYGPAAGAVDCSHPSFSSYHSGIYDDPSCFVIDVCHAIGIVGWGVEGDKKFWIVKNSWGTGWGEGGYMRLIWKDNHCGIAKMCWIPIA